jgi:hypothetical protein
MFCSNCGKLIPSDANFCKHCGRETDDQADWCKSAEVAIASSKAIREKAGQAHIVIGNSQPKSYSESVTAAVDPHPGPSDARPTRIEPARIRSSAAPSYTGALVLGWLFISAGFGLVLAFGASIFSSADLTPPPTIFFSRRMGIAAAIFQGVLFVGTGVAILGRRRIAVKLVWTVTVLAAIGVAFRGLVPLDILLWLVSLGIAKWFSGKASLLK